MKRLLKDRSGFSAVELLVILFVLVAVGVTGYFAYNRMQTNKVAEETGTSQTTKTEDSSTVPEVKSTDDLDKASSALDSTKLDDGSDTSIDTEVNKF